MKSIAAFAAINAFFVALNAAGALAFLGLFKLGQAVAPDLIESPLVAYPLGILGLAVTIGCARLTFRLMERLGRGRGHGPA